LYCGLDARAHLVCVCARIELVRSLLLDQLLGELQLGVLDIGLWMSMSFIDLTSAAYSTAAS
jgi:hypothetical protein